MQSADRHGGWQNHFRRTNRWANRANAALVNLPNTDFHDALDYSLAYFVWSHSLREWLIRDKALSQSSIDAALKTYPEWKIVRDLANRSRHLVITQNPADAEWSVSREYDLFAPAIEGRERHHVNLYFDGRKWRLVDLIGASGRMWNKLLCDQGLI